MKETRVGKAKGQEDTYVFVTFDHDKASISHMSHGFTQEQVRDELKKQGFSESEIDAMIAHADANPA